VSPPPAGVRGRFAPSPTGPLHFGSLVAALGSFLQARTRRGEWLVRMEDIDPPREQPGAADAILKDLERMGLEWDGEVLYQSTRLDAYAEALERLREQGMTFECTCSRRELAAATGEESSVYPGTCRERPLQPTAPRAIRVRVRPGPIEFDDGLQGPCAQDLMVDVGDFVLRRRDGLVAYQLAVVVDDAYQGITEVVRGTDLIDSTPRQIYLQRLLSVPTPAYAHLPIALTGSGEKLSKQTGARPVADTPAGRALVAALRFLRQGPPASLEAASPVTVIDWALENWDPAPLRGHRCAPGPEENPLDAAQ
jgi:glutamyl-Q tRNA(Asp) synthetase